MVPCWAAVACVQRGFTGGEIRMAFEVKSALVRLELLGTLYTFCRWGPPAWRRVCRVVCGKATMIVRLLPVAAGLPSAICSSIGPTIGVGESAPCTFQGPGCWAWGSTAMGTGLAGGLMALLTDSMRHIQGGWGGRRGAVGS